MKTNCLVTERRGVDIAHTKTDPGGPICLFDMVAAGDDTQSSPPTVRLEASPAVLRIIRTCAPKVVVLTPAVASVTSLTNLKFQDGAFCVSSPDENGEEMVNLYAALGIHPEHKSSVSFMGDNAYRKRKVKPLFYLTHSEVANRLAGIVALVEFVSTSTGPHSAH